MPKDLSFFVLPLILLGVLALPASSLMRQRYFKLFLKLQDAEVAAQLATGSRAPWRRIQLIAEGFKQLPFRPKPFEATGLLVFEADALRIRAVRLDGSRIDRCYPLAELSPERPAWMDGEGGKVWVSLMAEKPSIYLTSEVASMTRYAGQFAYAGQDLFALVSALASAARSQAGGA